MWQINLNLTRPQLKWQLTMASSAHTITKLMEKHQMETLTVIMHPLASQ